MGSARVNSFSSQRLQAARRAAGLTQADLARALGPGTWRTDIWRYEHNLRWPSPRTLARLAAALNVASLDLTTAAEAPTVADLRQLAGLTQAETATGLGITVDQWATLEHGRGRIDVHAAAVAAAFDVTPDTVRAAHERVARNAAQNIAA